MGVSCGILTNNLVAGMEKEINRDRETAEESIGENVVQPIQKKRVRKSCKDTCNEKCEDFTPIKDQDIAIRHSPRQLSLKRAGVGPVKLNKRWRIALNVSSFVPKEEFLKEILLHYFIQNKSASEAHRVLVETYGDHALSEQTCIDWFKRFNNKDYNVKDK
ncbi:uncharacterized protein LOC143192826 isoform X2 [Rhynchophorus ferrugineus]|uniref:uncharacterized protein LOC143192826 isoform X2 n=1 Tax=Rhynchophorus ferrugineus TaxID=354439 RepID=UPI003FCD67D3